jgi:cytochrome c
MTLQATRRPILAATLAVTASAALAIALHTPTPAHAQSSQPDPAADPAFYTTKVQPILQANCYRCHSGLNHRGGLSMDTRAALLKGGHEGVVIVPGHPEQSLFIKLIRHEGPAKDPMPMPPKSKISDADIATITQWIQAGAIMPAAQ